MNSPHGSTGSADLFDQLAERVAEIVLARLPAPAVPEADGFMRIPQAAEFLDLTQPALRMLCQRGLVLKHALVEEYIASNPFDRISRKQSKVKKVPHRYLSPAEVARLLDNSNGYRPFFELLAFAGLRVSEAAGLVWSDIDLTEGTINVRAQLTRGAAERVGIKNDEERIVNIDPALVAVLKDHKEKALALGRHKPTDWVFQTADGNPYDYRNLWGIFQTAAKRAKLNGVEGRKLRIHDLRRTYASILLNDGQPAAFVAKQLGHTVDVLFRTYAGLIENQQGQHRERQLVAVAAFRSGGAS